MCPVCIDISAVLLAVGPVGSVGSVVEVESGMLCILYANGIMARTRGSIGHCISVPRQMVLAGWMVVWCGYGVVCGAYYMVCGEAVQWYIADTMCL